MSGGGIAAPQRAGFTPPSPGVDGRRAAPPAPVDGTSGPHPLLRVLRPLVLLCAAACALLVVAMRNRGIDFTDESFYLLGLRPAQDRQDILSDWQQIVVLLTGGRELSVGTWRIASVLVLLAGGAVLAMGLHRYLRAVGAAGELTRHRLTLGGFCALGMLGYFCHLPPTLSYNVLTAGVLYACTGLALAVVADPWPADRGGRARRLGMSAAMGGLMALELWAKAPVPFELAAVLAVFALVTPLPTRRTALLPHVAAAIVGVAVGVGLYFLLVRSPAAFRALAGNQARALAGSGHGPGTLLAGYWADARGLLGLLARLIPVWLVVGAAAWVAARDRPVRPVVKLAAAAALMASAAFAGLLFWRRGFLSPSGSFFAQRSWMYICFLSILAAAWLGARLGGTRAERPARDGTRPAPSLRVALPLLLLLLCLPVVGALGSNNNLGGQSTVYAAGWMLAWVLMCEQLAAFPRLRALGYLAAIGAVVVAGGEFFYGSTVRPYRAGGSRWQQTERLRTAVPAVGPLRVSPMTRQFVDSVGALLAANGYQTGEPIVELYFYPGLVYLLGGTSPGTPAFLARHENQARNCDVLTHSPTTRRVRFYLVGVTPLPETLQCLGTVHPRVPAQMRLVGQVPIPNARRDAAMRVYRVD